MAPGRARETREVFATTAPSRRPAPVARPGMQRHVNLPACLSERLEENPWRECQPRVWKVSCAESHPHSAIARSEETLLRSETVEFRAGSECRTLLAAPSAKGALARAGMISPLLRGWLRSQGTGTTSLRFSNARVMPCSLAAIQVPPPRHPDTQLWWRHGGEPAEALPLRVRFFRRDSSQANSRRYEL
jgi:hypothetical protein